MRSDGFTLLEALLAMSLVTLVGVSFLSGFSRTLSRENELLSQYHRTEWARSLLEEYLATYPNMPENGTISDYLRWEISEVAVPPLAETRYDTVVSLGQVTVTVYPIGNPKKASRLSQVILRKQE